MLIRLKAQNYSIQPEWPLDDLSCDRPGLKQVGLYSAVGAQNNSHCFPVRIRMAIEEEKLQ
jgi:hypothetical protein